jgi:hypothetical protein
MGAIFKTSRMHIGRFGLAPLARRGRPQKNQAEKEETW